MPTITLGPPLARLSHELEEARQRCAAAQSAARHWQVVAEQAEARAAAAQRAGVADGTAAAALREEAARLRAALEEREGERDRALEEVGQLRAAAGEAQGAMAARVAELETSLAALQAELQQAQRVREVDAARLEAARRRLGLSDREARQFVQELDEARHAAEALRRERDQLAADHASLRRQCDARSAHVAVLLDSNHRRGALEGR